MKKNVILRFAGINYKLLSFDLNSNIDGSLYLNFIKDTIIHYHSSGQINYKLKQGNFTVFCEPIADITKSFDLSIYFSLPIEKLNHNQKIKDDDFYIDYSGSNKINIKLMIAPLINDISGYHIEFYRLFKIIIQIEDANPTNDKCTFIIPNYGLYSKICVQPEQSLIDFHQKLHNYNDLIIYEPNNEGVIKIIHSTPMRVAPKLKIEFHDNTLVAEQIYSESTVSLSKFIVKDKYGNKIKTNISIKTIELDSEL